MAILMKARKNGSSTSVVSSKRPYNFSSPLRLDTTTHAHALESLLRNPIKFVPAKDRTKHDRQKMALSISDRVSKWKIDRDRREKRRRLAVGASV